MKYTVYRIIAVILCYATMQPIVAIHHEHVHPAEFEKVLVTTARNHQFLVDLLAFADFMQQNRLPHLASLVEEQEVVNTLVQDLPLTEPQKKVFIHELAAIQETTQKLLEKLSSAPPTAHKLLIDLNQKTAGFLQKFNR
jgi:hypothetical protein